MVDAALNIAAEQVVEYTAYGRCYIGPETAGRRPRRRTCTAPVSSTSSAGTTLVAIAVETDGQWESPEPPSASRSGPRTRPWPPRSAAGRKKIWSTSTWAPGAASAPAKRWWPRWLAGVPVAKVMQPHRQTELEQLVARGFFERLEHR